MPMVRGSFLVGATYYSRSSGPHMWERFDRSEVAADFETAALLRLDTLRIVLSWDVFQPDAARVSTQALRDFETLLDLAAEHRLSIIVAILAPVFGGIVWLPPWALALDVQLAASSAPNTSPHRRTVASMNSIAVRAVRNPFVDPFMLAAQELLVREVVGNFADHPAVTAWQVADRMSAVAPSPSPDATAEWLSAVALVARAHDTVHPLLCGLSHSDLTAHSGIDPMQIAVCVDGLTLSMPPAGEDPVLPWRLAALVSALGGPPPLAQGLGICTVTPGVPSGPSCIPEVAAARWTEEALETLSRRGGTCGALAPMLFDIPEGLGTAPPFDRAPWLRTLGVIRADGSPKPAAEVWVALGRQRRQPEPADIPVLDPAEYWRGLPASYEVWQNMLRERQ